MKIEFESKNGVKKLPSLDSIIFKELSGFNRYRLEFEEFRENVFINILKTADPEYFLLSQVYLIFGKKTKILELLIEGDFDPNKNNFIGKIQIRTFDGSVGVLEGNFKNLKLEGKGCRLEVIKENQEEKGSAYRSLVTGEFKNGVVVDFRSEKYGKENRIQEIFEGKVLHNVDDLNANYFIQGYMTSIVQSEDARSTIWGLFNQDWSPVGRSRCEWNLKTRDMKVISEGVHTLPGNYDPNQGCKVEMFKGGKLETEVEIEVDSEGNKTKFKKVYDSSGNLVQETKDHLGQKTMASIDVLNFQGYNPRQWWKNYPTLWYNYKLMHMSRNLSRGIDKVSMGKLFNYSDIRRVKRGRLVIGGLFLLGGSFFGGGNKY